MANFNIDELRLALTCGKNSCPCSRQGPKNNVHCPAHDDRNPSLSIGEVRTGNILIYCFAGCSSDSVVKAAGLNYRDLFKRGSR